MDTKGGLDMPLNKEAVVKDIQEAIQNLYTTMTLTNDIATLQRFDGMVRAYEAVLDSIELGVWDE